MFRIRQAPVLSKRAHVLEFRSRHGAGGGVWPIHDLIFNDILAYLLPTYRQTLLLKFLVVLVFLLVSSGYFLWVAADVDSSSSLTVGAVLTATITIIAWWCYYYRRVLIELVWHRYEWMDPQVVARNRLPMHVSEMRWFATEAAARCATTLVQ